MPEYAFNEYLQIGLEQGIGGWIVFVSWLGSMMYYGIRKQAAWSGRRRVGTGSVCNVVLSVAVAVVLDDTGVFGGDMRDERWDAGKIIRLICVISVPYNYNKPVVACIRLPVHLAERAI